MSFARASEIYLDGLCPMINATANLSLTIQSVTPRNVARTQLVFSCDAGYNLIGPSNIECLESGRWSDTPPVCKKSSGKLCHLVAGIKESSTIAKRFSCVIL